MYPPPLVTPRFLLSYSDPPDVTDYRPVVSRDATWMVFERTPLPVDAKTRLFKATLPFSSTWPLNDLDESTRPDWCWQTDQIAFSNSTGVWIQNVIPPDPPPPPPRHLGGTARMLYPAWSPTGDFLVTDTDKEGRVLEAVPHSTKITPTGDIILENIAGNSVWAGMPTVNPRQPSQVAFAGQWTYGRPNRDYKQDENYILIFDMSTQELRPLEPGTPTQPPFDPNFQGRAPWWSPDGNWIVFESSRRDPQGQLYAIFIKNTNPFDLSPAMQVTSVEWNANHAKWYPDGKQLVVAVLQKPAEPPVSLEGARGIACLDVSAFV